MSLRRSNGKVFCSMAVCNLPERRCFDIVAMLCPTSRCRRSLPWQPCAPEHPGDEKIVAIGADNASQGNGRSLGPVRWRTFRGFRKACVPGTVGRSKTEKKTRPGLAILLVRMYTIGAGCDARIDLPLDEGVASRARSVAQADACQCWG